MRVIRVNAHAPEQAAIEEAAALLRRGRLVAFPTETVYGLGANALDPAAVDGIYRAKGRPSVNPLIVHVASVADARALTPGWTDVAERLARTYWPGPLTLVLPKRDDIPDIVTAGGDTVGLRVPGHPVALALIEAAGMPLAAPSANRSNQISPTTAQHVARSLEGQVELVLDAGPTTVGIESTVVDVTGPVPRILRPGMITLHAIVRVAGAADFAGSAPTESGALRSPGMLDRHYAPLARVRTFERAERDTALAAAAGERDRGARVGILLLSVASDRKAGSRGFALEVPMPDDPDGYARALYAALHEVDAAECDVVFVEMPPDSAEWVGVRDRLRRAATPD